MITPRATEIPPSMVPFSTVIIFAATSGPTEFATLFMPAENASKNPVRMTKNDKILFQLRLTRNDSFLLINLIALFKQKENKKARNGIRSEEHTSELQSRGHLVCRLLLEKKKKTKI